MRNPETSMLRAVTPTRRRRFGFARIAAAQTLFALLCVAPGALADPALTPIHLRVAGREVVCQTPPVADENDTYLPLDALSAVGAQAKITGRGDTARVTLGNSGREAELAVARPGGRPMLALSDVARFLNAVVVRTERIDAGGHAIPRSKGDTVYLLARVLSVTRQAGTVRIATSFPVSYHVRRIYNVTPPRGIVDCVGADAHRDPVVTDASGSNRIQTAQYSIDTARVTVETTRNTALVDADGIAGPDGVIVAAPAHRRSIAKATGVPLVLKRPEAPTPPVTGSPTQPPAALDPPASATGGNRIASASTSRHEAPPLPDDADRNVQDPDTPPDGDKPHVAGTDPTPATRADLPSRDGRAAPRSATLQVTGLEMQYDSDTQVEVKIAISGTVNPYAHYLENGDLAVDLPNANLALDDPSQADRKLPHPLLSGVKAELVRESPLITRITLHTPRVVGFTVVPGGDGVLLDLRLPTNATGALADKVIVVDAGHGGTSTGATGGGIYEKNITLALALKLRAHLEAAGAKVVMTRDRDVNVALDDRPHLANAINADLFISVHNDSNGVPNSASGTSTYYHMKDPSSRAMAQCVQQAIIAVSGLPSRGVLSDSVMYQSGFAVLRLSKMPAVLVEMAYINNARDRQKLADEEFQERVAAAMCDGLKAYVEGRPQTAVRIPTLDETRDGGGSSNR